MTSWVCLDANILLKLVLNEPDSHLVDELWRSWLDRGVYPAAPYLFPFEITVVIRKLVFQRKLDAESGLKALRKALAFDVQLLTFPGIHEQAWFLASRFNQPATYETFYLALAERLGCEFWTADHRLVNTVRESFPWIRWLGDYKPAL